MLLVIYPPLDPVRLALVREAAGSMQVINAETPAEARQALPDANAFFGKITPELLAAATRLRWIQAATASLEHYIFPELVAHPSQLSNMRGLFSDVIADHVMGYILCFARNLHRYLRQQQQAHWEPIGGEAARSNFSSGPGQVSAMDRAHLHLADASLGIVGVGAIGAEIARRASAFGMTLHGVDPIQRELPGLIPEILPPARLPELLAVSDFVVIAAPHTPQTEKWFRFEQFQQMRRTAYLINIGRGAIVDLADLTRALQEAIIAGAALDVFETEPLPKEHPLWQMENVLITPHVAAACPRIAERHTATLLENVRRFAQGETPINLVDKTQWF